MKLTITLEDLPDGGVFISGDPSLKDLCARATTPAKLTSAEGYAMQAWIALQVEQARAAKERARKLAGGLH